jgi:hypothetical protein
MQLATVDENEPLHVVADEEDAAMLHHVRTIQDLLIKYSDATDLINAALHAMQEVCFDKVNADLIYTDTVASLKLKTLRKDLAAKKQAAIAAASALDAANAACSKDAIYAKAASAIESYVNKGSDEDACRHCVRKCIDDANDIRKAAREAAGEANCAMAIANAAIQALAKETKCRVLTIESRYRQDDERMRHTIDEALIARKRYFIDEFQETFADFL